MGVGGTMLTENDKKDLRQRLKKVSGQINGVDKMLDDGRYCVDIVQQILAARAALNKLRGCGDQGRTSRPEHRRINECFEAV